MLLTGSKEESTLKFYEQAGYNKNDKTALFNVCKLEFVGGCNGKKYI